MSCPFMDLALILDGSQWKRIPICLRTGSVGDGICGGPDSMETDVDMGDVIEVRGKA